LFPQGKIILTQLFKHTAEICRCHSPFLAEILVIQACRCRGADLDTYTTFNKIIVTNLELELVARLILGFVLSGLVGLEREVSLKPAGLRTHILVGLGSTLFTVLSLQAFPGSCFHRRWNRLPRSRHRNQNKGKSHRTNNSSNPLDRCLHRRSHRSRILHTSDRCHNSRISRPKTRHIPESTSLIPG